MLTIFIQWLPKPSLQKATVSYSLLCFSVSHSFTAGDRNGAQLGPCGQTIGPLSRHTAPGNRIRIRQKQLSLVCGKEQRQHRGDGDLTTTLQILLKDFGLAPQTRAARPCLCAPNHLFVLTPHIYFVDIFCVMASTGACSGGVIM